MQSHTFDCQLFIPRHGRMRFVMPMETGPLRVARFEYLSYEEISDPSFRKLLAAFQTIPVVG